MTVTINGNGTITPASAIQPAGSILQVVQTVKTDTSSAAAQYDSPADLGISCSITPSATSSKILVDCNLNIGSQDFFGIYLNLLRGSTNILLADADGSRTRASKYIDNYANSNDFYNCIDVNIKYLDSPSYSLEDTITYKIQSAAYSASRTVYLNRNHNNRDSADYDGRGTSTITLMEIAG